MRRTAAVLALGATLGACTAGEPRAAVTEPVTLSDPPSPSRSGAPPSASESTATPTVAATPSPTATEVDVTTTPDEVTPAYVDAVVNELLGQLGRSYASILTRNPTDQATPTDDELARIRAMSDREFREERLDEAQRLASSPDERSQLLPADQFDGLRFRTVQVKAAEDGCIVAAGEVDRSGATRDGGVAPPLRLVSLQPAGDDEPANGTPWVIVDILGAFNDGEPVPDDVVLDATVDQFEPFLTNGCAP